VEPLTRPAPARDRIVADVVRGIEDGTLAAGQVLDSEAVLARRYSVSRGTVRTALLQLAGAGAIESIPGTGWFVRGAGAQASSGPQKRIPAVVQELREELRSAVWVDPGKRFLSEKDLCERFDLTRYGARAVLSALEHEGLIVTVHGRGRFVVDLGK